MKKPLHAIENIITVTDFSPIGDLAVMRGAHIAKELGKQLHILHVVNPLDIYPELMISFGPHAKEYERLKRLNGIETLDKLAASIRKEFGVKAKTVARIGRTHSQIIEYANAQTASLIVAGNKGENSVLRVMMGSTAYRLLNNKSCPVLIVRNTKLSPYEQVLTAVDFSPISKTAAKLASTIASDAKIELLHVFDTEQEARIRDMDLDNEHLQKYREQAINHAEEELKKMVKELSESRISSMVVSGYLTTEIYERAANLRADLIVLGRHGKGAMQEFMLGSVSKAVAEMVDCDVLVV